MNYQTKLAAAANDYQLGVKVAELAKSALLDMAGLDDIPGMIPGTAPSLKERLIPHADEMYRYLRSPSQGASPLRAAAGAAPTALRELAGHRGVQTAAALAALGGTAAAGAHAYKQHQRNKLLKQLALGGGLAAGGLAHHFLSGDE